MFEKILVCLDGSELAEQILPYVVEQARQFKSKVVLLQIITPSRVMPITGPSAAGVPFDGNIIAQELKWSEKEAKKYLETKVHDLQKQGLDVEQIVLEGTPGKSIVDYADDNSVRLIAIATHGRSGLGRAIFGSVADYVLRQSGLPILVIKPR